MSAPQRPGHQPPRPPHYGMPNETEWIPRVQEPPRRDHGGQGHGGPGGPGGRNQGGREPYRAGEEPPRRSNPAATWALRIGGLVAVAVVSGVVWSLIQSGGGPVDEGPSESTPQVAGPPPGRYTFAPATGLPTPRVDKNCAEHAYGDMEKHFQNTPCTQLTRALYTTELDGKTIYSAVMIVRMDTEGQAAEVRDMVNRNGTGNVEDPINAGIVKVEGITTLARGGYYDLLSGVDVIIVESDWAPTAPSARPKADIEKLKAVSEDAIRYGTYIAAKQN